MADQARTTEPATTPRSAQSHRPITVRSRLVRYDDRPDRRTVYPPGCSGDARLSTWLSADSDAFVDLETVR
jgi:hypothetical protein